MHRYISELPACFTYIGLDDTNTFAQARLSEDVRVSYEEGLLWFETIEEASNGNGWSPLVKSVCGELLRLWESIQEWWLQHGKLVVVRACVPPWISTISLSRATRTSCHAHVTTTCTLAHLAIGASINDVATTFGFLPIDLLVAGWCRRHALTGSGKEWCQERVPKHVLG